MRKKLCPKCKIPNFYLKSLNWSEILPVYVDAVGSIIPKREGDSIEGFDTETIYCLGCSWSGSIADIIR